MTTLEEIWSYKKKDYKPYDFDKNIDLNSLRNNLINYFKEEDALDENQLFIVNNSDFVVKNNLIDVYKHLNVKYDLQSIWDMKKSSLDWILWYHEKDVEKNTLRIKIKIFKLFKKLKILNGPLINGFYAIKELGKGSFGVVYECINFDLDHVVIKEVEIDDKSQIEIDNMEAVKDDCENYFSCIIDHKKTEEKLYIIMEYLDGYFPLGDFNPDNKTIKKIIINLFKGIRVMHSLDVSHNDIKPDNIMVNKNGDIKYIDFGGACLRNNCEKPHCYTFKYTDPTTMYYNKESKKYKKIRNKQNGLEIAKQADLWGLGIVIYDLIIGRTPYSLLPIDDTDLKKKTYVETYDFQKDKNREKVIKFLKKIGSEVNIDDLLTKSTKKYFY